jgi:hypothetical protein
MSDDPDSEGEADEVETAATDDADEEDVPAAAGGVEDTDQVASVDDEDAAEERGDETVPNVELSLYELSVRVSGRSDDGLRDVEESATRLMDYLIERSKELEERPDDRGLG